MTHPRSVRDPFFGDHVPDISLVLTGLVLRLALRWEGDGGRERGDVPGWVLITIMTAGLVTALWAVAKGQLTTILQNALNAVKGPG